jgi:hypothetical protein
LFRTSAECWAGVVIALGLVFGGNALAEAVRKVETKEVADAEGLAKRAREVGNALYPKVVAVLTAEPATSPAQFDIVFKPTLERGNRGVTTGRTIYLNTQWLQQNAANFDHVLVHEMAHVAQSYPWFRWRKTPSYWVEGMADYTCYKLGFTNDWWCPECGEAYPHYTSGYRCTGAFLLYVDNIYGEQVIRDLNQTLCRGKFSDAFFKKATGQTLTELWQNFQKTSAYKPEATDAYKLRQLLGYPRGQPPRNAAKRALAYLKKAPGGKLTLEASQLLRNLCESNQLPGFFRDLSQPKREQLTVGLEPEDFLAACESVALPATRKFFAQLGEEGDRVHYVLHRASAAEDWKIQRAWRSDTSGRVLEELATPLGSQP